MEFKEKQYDGIYEISAVEFQNENQIFRGLLYFPHESFQKPYSLIIYFHGFPQISPLEDIVKQYKFLLDLGYAFLVFNFRGYFFNQGSVSISSQVADSMKVLEFVRLMTKENIFNINDINLLGHDFGAYISLILSSNIKIINRLLLLCPIIDLKRHVNHPDFARSLHYLNRFLPGYVNGIGDVESFIRMTNNELKSQAFQIKKIITKLNYKKLKIILGDKDKLTSVDEIRNFIQNEVDNLELAIIKNMSHDYFQEDYAEKMNEEVMKLFFKLN
jgi:pimeloyl-ACP methyl ester carboxylesterase